MTCCRVCHSGLLSSPSIVRLIPLAVGSSTAWAASQTYQRRILRRNANWFSTKTHSAVVSKSGLTTYEVWLGLSSVQSVRYLNAAREWRSAVPVGSRAELVLRFESGGFREAIQWFDLCVVGCKVRRWEVNFIR